MTQQARLHEPYPWTWEPAALAVAMALAVLGSGVQVGRALANHLAGAPWQLPPATGWLRTVPAVLAGDAQAGLDPSRGPFAAPALLAACIAAVEVVCLALVVAALVIGVRRWQGRVRGVATPSEVARALGRRRLRRSRTQIRPDLYSGRGKRP